MIVTHKLILDLVRAGVTPRIDVSQDDRYSRNLEIRLQANGVPFYPPEECEVMIRYQKPDRTGGSYDALPDGSTAWSLSGNVLTVALAPQVCTVPGTVHMVISFLRSAAELSSFALQLEVHRRPEGMKSSSDYVNVTGFVPQPGQAEVGQYLQVAAVDDHGRITVMGTGAGSSAATLEIAAVEALEHDTEPAVTELDGSTSWARIYKLGIPRGEPGEQGPQGLRGEQGESGKNGTDGQDGSTPVKGVDYWTEADKETITAEVDSHMLEQLAAKSQLMPEYADTIEKCTDTTKLYVLPDGFIYAYMYTEAAAGAAYTNRVATAQDFASEELLNGTGYMDGYYASSSSPYYGTDAACVLTGWIPGHSWTQTEAPPTLYIKGAVVDTSNSHCRIQFSGDKADIGGAQGSLMPTYYTVEELDTAYYRLTPVILDTGESQIYHTYSDGYCGYIRFSLLGTGEDLIITFDEEIVEGEASGSYGWANTGHAFVPADYENRIISLEETAQTQAADISGHEVRIGLLENGEGVPDYVVTEAESVIDRVIAAQGSNTFVLGAITDIHYGNAACFDGVIHACQALQYIDKRIKLDAVAVLGDYTDGYPTGDYDNAIGDFKAINAVLNGLRFAPNLRLQGNHDFYGDAPQMIHRYIQAYNDDVVWGDKLGGYCYRDLEVFKLRIICVNTTEEDSGSISCTAAQYQWFANALDLSAREDAGAWKTLVLSHHPLDWYTVDGAYVFGSIIEAYTTGGTFTACSGSVSYDYAGKNTAALIGNIHGHIHNLLTDYIFQDTGAGTKTMVYRFATPEACTGRENQYTGVWAEDTGYPKTANTAEDTAFCIYCIDLDANTVQAICYGAGYDRSVSF